MKASKSPLFQWDVNQTLMDCQGSYIEYVINNEVYRVEINDGVCMIPDEFFQSGGMKKVYEVYSDGTIRDHNLYVEGRPQPPDYIFTPTERITFDSLVEKVDNAVDDMYAKAEAGDFDGADGVDGRDGVDGTDGFSPTATVERTSDGAVITITDKDGTTTAEVYDGEVDDVQINGTSIVDENKVANIVANNLYGVGFNQSGLFVAGATPTEISARNNGNRPIVTTQLDLAVKTAMCDGVGASWSDSEKASARARLGVVEQTEKPFELIETIQVETDTYDIERSVEPNGNAYSFKKIRVEFSGDEYGSSQFALGLCVNYTQKGYSSPDSILRRTFGTNSKYMIFANLYCENNNIFGETFFLGSVNDYNATSAQVYKPLIYKVGDEINKICISAYNASAYSPIKAGTTIKIYGVRK